MSEYENTHSLTTVLSREQLLSRLRQNIDKDRDVGAIFSTYEGRHALIGIVEGYRFRVFLRSLNLRNVAGDFQGEIFQGATGSRIDGRFLNAEKTFLSSFGVGIVEVFMAKFSAAWTSLLCAGLWCWWIVRGAQADETVPLLLLTPVCLLVLIYTWRVVRRHNHGQRLLLQELANIAAVEPSTYHLTGHKTSRLVNRKAQLPTPWSRLNASGNSRS